MSTCKASCADRPGRNPNEQSSMSASKIGSSTILSAACTIRSRTVGSTAVAAGCCPAWDEHPPRRQWPIPPLLEVLRQLPEQPGYPIPLDVRQRGLVDAGRAAVAAHLLPRPVQHVPAVDLVEPRMEPSARVGLGRPVQRMLQGPNPVVPDSGKGGTSRHGTHPIPPAAPHEQSSGPSQHRRLCCPTARPVLRPPPTPSRPPPTSRLHTGDRTTPSTPFRSALRPGRPPQFPPPPSQAFRALLRRGVLRGCPSRIFTASMAFTVNRPARLSLNAYRRGRLRMRCGPLSCSPQRGFRRWASTRPVTRPSRQPATGPPGSFPDGTHTRWRRRAYLRIRSPHQPPPKRWAHVVIPAKDDTRLQARLPDFTRESPGDRPEVADSVVRASGRANPHQ